MTGAVNSHEILVMPTTAMDERSKDYALVCALPVDAPGITMIFGRQASDDRRDKRERIDVGKPSFGAVGGEAVIAFEDVFVPKETDLHGRRDRLHRARWSTDLPPTTGPITGPARPA